MNLEKANATLKLGDVLLNNMAKQVQLLKEQRDELLEALDYTASLLEASGRTALTARQAIAKAKGEKGEDSQAVLKIIETISYVPIPLRLAKTLLGVLESEYEGTEMFQDEINELKGLL